MFILLDIDGVMVTTPGWRKVELLNDQFSAFNGRAAENLQRIISETNATVVLTTSHKSSYSIVEWKAILKKRGINVHSLARLDENINYLSRKDEILNWLNDHPSIENFVIIDDDRSLNDLPYSIKEKCILTDSLIGLNEEKATAAIGLLNGLKVNANVYQEEYQLA